MSAEKFRSEPNVALLLASATEQARAHGIELPEFDTKAVAGARVVTMDANISADFLVGRQIHFIDQTPNAFRRHQEDVEGHERMTVPKFITYVMLVGIILLFIGGFLVGIVRSIL